MTKKADFIDTNDPKHAVRTLDIGCHCEIDVYWFRFPKSEWSDAEAKKQRDDAAAWYAKYCITINFKEITPKGLDADLRRYEAQMKLIPQGKAAKQADLNDLQAMVDRITKELISQLAPKKTDPIPLLVLFLDEWFNTVVGKTYRVSANSGTFWLIGMTRYDRDSQNMLTHELIHALQRTPPRGGKGDKRCIEDFEKRNNLGAVTPSSWEAHYAGANQAKAMSHVTRTNGLTNETDLGSDRVLTTSEYVSMLGSGALKCAKGCTDEEKKEERKR